MELKNVFVIKCNKLEDWSLKKLALSDDDLSKLKDENLQENLKRNNIPDWTESNEKLKSSKKYKVYMKENTYHRSIFLHLKQNLKRKDIEGIGDISNIFYNKTPQYDTLVYLFEGKNKVKKYYIYKITRNLKLENQYLFMMELGHHHLGIRKKVGIDQLNSLHVIMGGLTLPIENCVGCFYEDNIQTYLEVYDASLFDDIFNTSETQEKYAHSAITNFNNKKWMIAESIQNPIKSEPGVTVKIPNNEEINQLIKKYHSVRKPLSNYTNNSKRIIKKINIKDLKRLIDELTNAVNDENKRTNFEIDNIPILDEQKRCLIVTEKSLPMFSAMLENKVIEKLLVHEISIPYFDDSKNPKFNLNESIIY